MGPCILQERLVTPLPIKGLILQGSDGAFILTYRTRAVKFMEAMLVGGPCRRLYRYRCDQAAQPAATTLVRDQ